MTTTPAPKIFAAMNAILADTDAIGKNQKNQAQGFKFRGIDDVMNELHSSFAKHRVFLTTDVLAIERVEKDTRNGGKSLHQFITYRFTFWADDGSSVSSTQVGEAADSGDKSSNKCASIALKYALLQTFLIPTEDDKDPDAQTHAFTSKGQPVATQRAAVAALPRYDASPDARRWLTQKATDLGIVAEPLDANAKQLLLTIQNGIMGKTYAEAEASMADFVADKAGRA
jgi:hypothetical protein